jgi:hypothetical protein
MMSFSECAHASDIDIDVEIGTAIKKGNQTEVPIKRAGADVTHILVVTGPVGKAFDISSQQEAIQRKWEEGIEVDNRVALDDYRELFFVKRQGGAFSREQTVVFPTSPRHYVFYALVIKGENATAYMPRDEDHFNSFDDTIQVTIECTERELVKKRDRYIAYEVFVRCPSGVQDGLLFYRYAGFNYPITQDLLNRSFWLSERPEFPKDLPGIDLNIRANIELDS